MEKKAPTKLTESNTKLAMLEKYFWGQNDQVGNEITIKRKLMKKLMLEMGNFTFLHSKVSEVQAASNKMPAQWLAAVVTTSTRAKMLTT